MESARSRAGSGLITRLLVRMLAVAILMPALLFLPAGTLDYWEAWVYLAIVLTSMSGYLLYFLENDPGLLERRMRAKEKETRQRSLVIAMSLLFFLAYLVPGFDRRFGWSSLPVAAVLLADLVVALSYALIFLVLRENRYASRIVEVEEGQEVVETGPYAVVRHPMYLGALLMMLAAPLALGSWWAVLPALANIPLLAARITDEEALLQQDLEGYGAYMERTRYRLVPGFW